MDLEKNIMIPDSEIPKCSEFEVKSEIGKIFQNHNPLKNILLGFLKLILIFINIMKKKYKLIKMGVNIYYIELMFILINFYQKQKLMKKDMLSEILFLMKKDKKPQKINLVVNLLELIQVMQKNGYDLDCEVGNIEYLLMSSKIKKQKNQKKKLIKKKKK